MTDEAYVAQQQLVTAFLMTFLRERDQFSFGLERDGGILAADFLVYSPHSEKFSRISTVILIAPG